MNMALKKPPEFEYKVVEKYNLEERKEVYKLWYQVYCLEMNRNLEYADHSNKIVYDILENNSYIIIAKIYNKIIGSFRVNFSDEIENNYYSDLYELDKINKTEAAIGTRYMIHSDYRGNYISFLLMETAINFLQLKKRKRLIIDCSPSVYGLFEKLGFTDYLGEKNSQEYGRVKIMTYSIF